MCVRVVVSDNGSFCNDAKDTILEGQTEEIMGQENGNMTKKNVAIRQKKRRQRQTNKQCQR